MIKAEEKALILKAARSNLRAEKALIYFGATEIVASKLALKVAQIRIMMHAENRLLILKAAKSGLRAGRALIGLGATAVEVTKLAPEVGRIRKLRQDREQAKKGFDVCPFKRGWGGDCLKMRLENRRSDAANNLKKEAAKIVKQKKT